MTLRRESGWGTFLVFLIAVGCSSSSDSEADDGVSNADSSAAGSADNGGSAIGSGGSTSGSGLGGSSSTGAGGTQSSGGAGGNGGSSNAGGSGTGGKGGSSNAGGNAGKGGAGGSGTGGSSAGAGGSTSTGSCSVADAGSQRSYCTDFNLTEAAISEGGAWTNIGLDWTFIETGGGNAYGTQPQPNKQQYDDSYAHLSGFPVNYTVSAVIHKGANIDGACTHEVEILLRWSDAAHDAHGYECNLAWDGGYAEIVRWNGKINDFTYLTRSNAPMGVHDGDTLSASIVGNLIKVTLNGVEIARATDSTFATGNPGMAFWRGGSCGTRGDYGFTHYQAMSLP